MHDPRRIGWRRRFRSCAVRGRSHALLSALAAIRRRTNAYWHLLPVTNTVSQFRLSFRTVHSTVVLLLEGASMLHRRSFTAGAIATGIATAASRAPAQNRSKILRVV